jgi:hypothetical protein
MRVVRIVDDMMADLLRESHADQQKQHDNELVGEAGLEPAKP